MPQPGRGQRSQHQLSDRPGASVARYEHNQENVQRSSQRKADELE
jgi:hypothetical protein